MSYISYSWRAVYDMYGLYGVNYATPLPASLGPPFGWTGGRFRIIQGPLLGNAE
jgi:hypothetical protein